MDRLRPWLRDHTWPYLVLAAVLAVLAWRVGFDGGSGADGAQPVDDAVTTPVAIADAPEESRAVLVHVAGEVKRPGLYRLPSEVRVMRAIRQAGGATRHADVAALNLAAPVQDGQRIVVPRRGASGTAGASGGGSVAEEGGGPISLSSATPEQLETLDGIGPKLAARIIEWRDTHGGFRSVEDLTDVPGIGDARLEALRTKLTP